MKNKKGITLIALIITIIVLLILAGVSISILTGENGVLTQAQESKEKTDKAHIQEMRDLTSARAAMNLEGYYYDYEKHQIVESRTAKTIYIPSGFAVSEVTEEIAGKGKGENEFETGLVIIDKMGDEFVWVPVEADGSDFNRKISTSYRITSGVGDEDGSSEIPNLGDDFGTNKLLSRSTSDGDEINDIEFKIVKNANGFFVSRYEIGIESIDRGISIADYMEQSSSDNDADYYLDTVDKEERRSLVPKLNSKKGMEPVRRISQLESLDLASEWKIGKDYQSGLMTGRTWDRMVSFICDDNYEGDGTQENPPTFQKLLANIDSSTWGNYGWNTKSITYKQILTSNCESKTSYATNWGWMTQPVNFSRTQLDGTERYIFPTGEFITDSGRDTSMKNVYDVAGNVWEWTTEESHYKKLEEKWQNRVLRGGCVNNKGNERQASCRNGSDSRTTRATWAIGFRCVLYVIPPEK